MKISSVKTSKCEVRYAKCCSGSESLIMLPGVSVTSVLNSAAAVEAAYESFNDIYTIYLFEYPREYPEGAEIRYIADSLAEAIRLLGLKDCYLFGASFGGMVSQVLLGEYPELFVSAVLSSTIARKSDTSPETIRRWHMIASSSDVRSLNLAFYDAVYSDEYQVKFAEPIRKTLDNGNEDDCRVMSTHTGMILRADLRENDKKIKAPVLVISSKQDHVFSVEDLSEPARLSGGRLFLYEGYGHAVFDEAPDFKEKILEHFAQTSEERTQSRT